MKNIDANFDNLILNMLSIFLFQATSFETTEKVRAIQEEKSLEYPLNVLASVRSPPCIHSRQFFFLSLLLHAASFFFLSLSMTRAGQHATLSFLPGVPRSCGIHVLRLLLIRGESRYVKDARCERACGRP